MVSTESAWRYCVPDRGRYRLLVRNSGAPGGYSDIVTVMSVRLIGAFASWVTDDSLGGGRYGEVDGVVNIENVRTGKLVASQGGCCGNPPFVLLSRSGIALWPQPELIPSIGYQPRWIWQIASLSSPTGRSLILATAPPSANGALPFTELRLESCAASCTGQATADAWWLIDGRWNTAPLD